ncbi:hypothetical protein KY284_026213 [Solanum tuberosum]|nr:hypothetical protein KY284_026213 [Solanum tuberosum]
MFESSKDSNSSANLSYGLLISRIIIDSLVDLSQFKHVFIDVTYDRTFSTMGYVLIDNKWHKKESAKERAKALKASCISDDSAAILLKEAKDIEVHLDGLKSYMQVLQDTIRKVLQISKDLGTDIGKLRLEVEGLKKAGSQLHQVNRRLCPYRASCLCAYFLFQLL